MSTIFKHFSNLDTDKLDEAIIQMGADFEVEKRDMFFNSNSVGGFTEPEAVENLLKSNSSKTQIIYRRNMVPYHAAIVRKDTNKILGVASRRYGVIQYKQAFSTTQELVDHDNVKYTAGKVIGDGERAYILMKDSTKIDLGDNVIVQCYFLISTSHDGKQALEINPTPIRMDNGTVLTFNQSGKVWMKHSRKVSSKIGNLRQSLVNVRSFWKEFEETAKRFSKVKITFDQSQLYLLALLPGDSTRVNNIRDSVTGIYLTGGQRLSTPCRETLLGIYMAVVEHVDRYKVVKKSSRIDENDARIMALVDGNGAKLKAEAYASMREFAKEMNIG